MDWNKLRPPYSGSTIAGLMLLAGAATSVLLGQADWRTATAGAITGLVGIVARQSTSAGQG